jgi:hypothetical protein
MAEYLLDPAAEKILQLCLVAVDRAEEARRLVGEHGIVVNDRFDQPKVAPWVVIERDATRVAVNAWKALGLEEPAPELAPSTETEEPMAARRISKNGCTNLTFRQRTLGLWRPVRSNHIRRMIDGGLTAAEARAEVERVDAQWQKWDAEHGGRWRDVVHHHRPSDGVELVPPPGFFDEVAA